MAAEPTATVAGVRVVIVGYAEGIEYLSAPFDHGRVIDRIAAKPRKGERMVKVRHADGRREWWPASRVKGESR